jgi:hypothetical protein
VLEKFCSIRMSQDKAPELHAHQTLLACIALHHVLSDSASEFLELLLFLGATGIKPVVRSQVS